MTDRFESILDESISALQAGVPLDEILAEVPEYAAELRPLLYAALLLADPNPKLAPAERKAALHHQYMAQVAQLPPVHPSLAGKIAAVWGVMKRRLTPKVVLTDLLTVTITILLTLVMAAALLGYAARDTIPGDLLYGIKQLSEVAQLLLTPNELDKQQLADAFNRRRLAEINQLIDQNRAAVIKFSGTLETKNKTLWIIEGYTVFLPEDTKFEGQPEEGDKVEVIGLLKTNNMLVADTVKVVK